MYRAALICLFSTALTVVSPLLAQDAEEAWKGLVVQALYASGENQYAKAEQLFLKAVHEAERFGLKDARVGTTLNSLGLVYRAEKKYSDAENAYRRALVILEGAYGPETVDVANVNFNIGTVLREQGKEAAALPFLQKTLSSYEALLGGSSIKTGAVLCLIGDTYRGMKDYPKAAVNLKRCADIREADGGMQNPELAEALHSLALTFAGQGKFANAEADFKLAEKIVENTSGISSPQLAGVVDDHIVLLKQMGGREKDIERYTKLSESIRRLHSKKK